MTSPLFASSLHKSIAPFLAPREELLGAVMAQAAGANLQLLARAVGGAAAGAYADGRTQRAHAAAETAAGFTLDRRMVLAITTQRLLIFKQRGAFTPKAKELLGERPIGDVHQIAVSKGVSTKAVTLHVAGTAIGVETARGQPAEILPHALLRAQAVA
jgi:hypothetical protein